MTITNTILTTGNINNEQNTGGLPTDILAAARESLAAGWETAIECRRTGGYNEQPMHFAYFPEAGRGAVSGGGNADWTACHSLDNLMDRWVNYDQRWNS